MSTSKKIAKNVMWKYLELLAVSGIQLVSTFFLARFLTPADYGILGMVVVFTTLANVIVDSGFGQALIREKEVTREDYSTIFYFNVLMSLLLYILLFYASGYISRFYNEPLLKDVCKVTFLVLPLNALSLVQVTKMQREIRFKKLCFVSLFSIILSSLVAIYLAYLYRNVWALVVQNVLIYFFKMLFLWITTDFIPVFKFSYISLKRFFKFSKNLMFSALIGTLFNNIYTFVIGKAYSATELGFYSQADRIKNLGSHTATQVIQSVTYPFLSKLNNNNEDIKGGYKKIISVTLIFVGTIMALLMGCSPGLFELLLGSPIWRASGTYFLLMGINGILYPLHCINQNILMVKGDSRTILRLEIIRRIIMVLIVAITINFDILVFVSGLTLYSVLLLFLNLYYCGKPIGYSVMEQLKDTYPIFLRLLIVIVASMLTSCLLSSSHLLVNVLASLCVGCVVTFLLFFRYRDFKLIIDILKSIIKRN